MQDRGDELAPDDMTYLVTALQFAGFERREDDMVGNRSNGWLSRGDVLLGDGVRTGIQEL